MGLTDNISKLTGSSIENIHSECGEKKEKNTKSALYTYDLENFYV